MASRVAGFDIGGTKIEALIRDDGGTTQKFWPTRKFGSVEELLKHAEEIRGTINKTVIAAAGRLNSGGELELTNVEWPPYTPGCVRIVNDVECAAAAMELLDPIEWRPLNNVVPTNNELIAVTISTGINSAYRDTEGKVHPAESGHTGWQPWVEPLTNDLPYHLLQYLQQSNPEAPTATVEDVLGGDRGFATLYLYLADFYPPGVALRRDIHHRRRQGQGIGPAITKAALQGDACAEMCMRLWGPILGQYLRERALSHLTQGGSIYLYGGIAQAEGVMDYVLGHTQFWQHFLGGKARMHDLMEEISLRLVIPHPQQPPLTVRGALNLARST